MLRMVPLPGKCRGGILEASPVSGLRLRLHPFPINCRRLNNRPGHRRRHVVAVQLGKAGNERVPQIGTGLEQSGDFLRLLDRALPAVDGLARAQDVGAGRESLFDKGSAEAPGFLLRGEGGVDGDDAGHAARSPSLCAVTKVAASSSTAFAWWAAAIHSATPESRVEMPSRICRVTIATSRMEGSFCPFRPPARASTRAAAATAKASQRWTNWTMIGLSAKFLRKGSSKGASAGNQRSPIFGQLE